MDENFNKHLGNKLKLRRLALGLTQTKVAKAINVTFQQIQKYEKGTNGVSSIRLLQLSNYLKVPINYFFEDYSEYLINLGKSNEGHMHIGCRDESLWPKVSYLNNKEIIADKPGHGRQCKVIGADTEIVTVCRPIQNLRYSTKISIMGDHSIILCFLIVFNGIEGRAKYDKTKAILSYGPSESKKAVYENKDKHK